MEKLTIYLAGDSTMSYYEPSRAPRAGWGQMIANYFSNEVIVSNHAASGRSSKSFITENRLTTIEKSIKDNDYLFIQFGHNDEKPDVERHTEPYTTFKQYLTRYIEAARKNNATPILLTPVQRRKFTKESKLMDTHGDYPLAIKQLAKELHVPLIDLTSKTTKLLEQQGPEQSKELFMWLEPNTYTNYPNGEQDDTHFCQHGANKVAQLVIQGIQELQLPLAKYIRGETYFLEPFSSRNVN